MQYSEFRDVFMGEKQLIIFIEFHIYDSTVRPNYLIPMAPIFQRKSMFNLYVIDNILIYI